MTASTGRPDAAPHADLAMLSLLNVAGGAWASGQPDAPPVIRLLGTYALALGSFAAGLLYGRRR